MPDKTKPNCGWHHSEETKRKIGEKSKGRIPSEKTREKLRKARAGRIISDKTKLKMSESRRGIVFSEEHRKHLSESHKGKPGFWTGKKRDIDTCRKVGEKTRNRKATIATRLRQRQSMLGKHNGKNNPMYIDGRSKIKNPYCEKFNNEFRERVRSFFGYVCVECGTPQNGKRLSVHHVNFRKDSCCNSEAPRLFVPLCRGCHSKTNRDREYWEQHFTEMLHGYHGGKSFFTKEEYAAYKNSN